MIFGRIPTDIVKLLTLENRDYFLMPALEFLCQNIGKRLSLFVLVERVLDELLFKGRKKDVFAKFFCLKSINSIREC